MNNLASGTAISSPDCLSPRTDIAVKCEEEVSGGDEPTLAAGKILTPKNNTFHVCKQNWKIFK